MTEQSTQTRKPLEFTARPLGHGVEKVSGYGNTAETQDMHFLARAFKVEPWEKNPEPGLSGSRIMEVSIYKKGALLNSYNGVRWAETQTEAEKTLVAAIAETFPAPTKD